VSFDLTVYVQRAADVAELEQIILGVPGLVAGAVSLQGASIERRARRRYCFTVDGPVRAEPEDVPDGVTTVLLGATHMCLVLVEGSYAADVPFAVRFARHLAQTLGGAVVDQQTDEIWVRGTSRRVLKPTRDMRISEVILHWYAITGSVPSDAAATYTALCRKYLPEALPRRFGEFEPLQSKLTDTGDSGFDNAWRAATSLLFFTASPPCIAGSMYAGPSETHPRKVWVMTLHVLRDPFIEPRWRDALRRLFVGIADRSECFFGSAEVTRGTLWNGRSGRADAQTEWPIMPARIEGWMGLPPYPVWWSWYGDPYRDSVSNVLDPDRTMASVHGIFHQWTVEPADRDALEVIAAPTRLLRRSQECLPSDLLSQVIPNDGRIRPTPLAHARHIPTPLK
jgi:hypothetical protein